MAEEEEEAPPAEAVALVACGGSSALVGCSLSDGVVGDVMLGRACVPEAMNTSGEETELAAPLLPIYASGDGEEKERALFTSPLPTCCEDGWYCFGTKAGEKAFKARDDDVEAAVSWRCSFASSSSCGRPALRELCVRCSARDVVAVAVAVAFAVFAVFAVFAPTVGVLFRSSAVAAAAGCSSPLRLFIPSPRRAMLRRPPA